MPLGQDRERVDPGECRERHAEDDDARVTRGKAGDSHGCFAIFTESPRPCTPLVQNGLSFADAAEHLDDPALLESGGDLCSGRGIAADHIHGGALVVADQCRDGDDECVGVLLETDARLGEHADLQRAVRHCLTRMRTSVVLVAGSTEGATRGRVPGNVRSG